MLAKVTTAEPGLLQCYGTRAGDIVAQALALSNGDNVTGVFAPVIPANEMIAQVRQGPQIECLIMLHRFTTEN